jgi:hypothetical protein
MYEHSVKVSEELAAFLLIQEKIFSSEILAPTYEIGRRHFSEDDIFTAVRQSDFVKKRFRQSYFALQSNKRKLINCYGNHFENDLILVYDAL